MVTRAEVVAEARSWIGTPFHHHACVKGVGVDCIHLAIGVCKMIGIISREYEAPAYSMTPDGVSLQQHCDRNMTRVRMDEMQPGDLCLFAISLDPQHVGIVGDYRYGGKSIIHALCGRGVVETRLMFSSALRFISAYRLPGVE